MRPRVRMSTPAPSSRSKLPALLWVLGGAFCWVASHAAEIPSAQVNRFPTISLTAWDVELYEHDLDAAVIEITSSQEIASPVIIYLGVQGTAIHGSDFDLPLELWMPSGVESRAVLFQPIRDWIKEGDETVEISIRSVRGLAHVDPTAKVNITIVDLFDDPDPEDPDDDETITTVRRPDLGTYSYFSSSAENLEVVVGVLNYGSEISSETTSLFKVAADPGFNDVVFERSRTIPAIDPQDWWGVREYVPVNTFEPLTTYFVEFSVEPGEEETTLWNNSEDFGFSTNSQRRIASSCEVPNRPIVAGGEDPLFPAQWHLNNVGQETYSDTAPEEGADINMNATIENGITGNGVVVAVVDTGMELCHPDLAENTRTLGSVNFTADDSSYTYLYGSKATDPYNPDIYGDHGTSVAGLIGSVAENGVGGRGVAPGVTLRAYNYLRNASTEALAISLGADVDPSDPTVTSSPGDVFNLSFGARLATTRSELVEEMYRHGIENLRDGKGAIYVKSAGNQFRSCSAIQHRIHADVGCRSTNIDAGNNYPFVIVVGASDAYDNKASYSSTGANIWTAAPSGYSGGAWPALITTDQSGKDRGYDLRYPVGVSASAEVNPHGDYISTFAGTSGSAPIVSGAIALMLEVQPELTWRDIKHVLANTSRWVDPSDFRVRVAINGTPVVLKYPWTLNAAGYAYHSSFGFGVVDVDNAMTFIESYAPDSLGEFTESDWLGLETETPILDGDGKGTFVDLEITLPYVVVVPTEDEAHADEAPVPELRTFEGANIESVQLRANIIHENLSDVQITLISPSGTPSIVNPVFNNALGIGHSGPFEMTSNAFYGEEPMGTWRVHFMDAQAEKEGTVEEVAIRFFYGQHPQTVEDPPEEPPDPEPDPIE